MKKLLLLLITTALFTSCSAVNNTDDVEKQEKAAFNEGASSTESATLQITTDDWQTYKNKEYVFEIKLPNTWSVTPLGSPTADFPDETELANSSFMLTGPNDSYYAPTNLGIRDNKENLSIPDWWLKNYPKNKEDLNDFSSINIDSSDAAMAWYHSNDPFKTYTYYIKKGDKIYQFSLMDIQENLANENEMMKTIVYSLKFIEVVDQPSALCTDAPEITDIGLEVYPIDSKYAGLGFLGQLFTAYNCGPERVSKIPGMEGENYVLGSAIFLKNSPNQALIDIFLSLGFKCAEENTGVNCKKWELWDSVKVDNLIKLEPYSENFEDDDCRNCG